MKTRPRLHDIARLVVVATVYLASAKVGLSLAFHAEQVTPVWPPAGIALAAYLMFGARVWPGIYAGAFIANATADESLITAAAIAAGNTVAWFVAAHLLRAARFAGSLERVRDVLAFVCCGCMAGALISATNGTIQLAVAGLIPWSACLSVWLVWWVGDALGVLIVAPVAITWAVRSPLPWLRRAELVLLLMATIAISYGVLTQSPTPFKYVLFPIIMWAALRFRQREVALTVIGIAAMAVWTVVRGRGPFVEAEPLGIQLLFLDAFLALTAITGLTVGAVVAERSRVQDALRQAHDRLGVLVEQRTAELTNANRQLAKAQEIAHVGSWQWTLPSREVRWSDELLRILDVDPTTFQGSYSEALEHVHPVDRERVDKIMMPMPTDQRPGFLEFRVTGPGDKIKTLQARSEVMTNADGQIIGVIGTVEDVTDQRESQRAIQSSLQEKELLLQEIHHRVKNNLQVISSLLSLQARFVAEPKVRELFVETNARVRSIALVHEDLYQVANLASIDAASYFQSLTRGLVQSWGALASVQCVAEGINLTIPVAIPCGLIVTELVSNALKHAFPNERRGNIVVLLTEAPPHDLLLEVRDDGIGIPAELDIKATKTMGLQLVDRLARQLHAVVDVERRGGTTFRVRFPRPNEAPALQSAR